MMLNSVIRLAALGVLLRAGTPCLGTRTTAVERARSAFRNRNAGGEGFEETAGVAWQKFSLTRHPASLGRRSAWAHEGEALEGQDEVVISDFLGDGEEDSDSEDASLLPPPGDAETALEDEVTKQSWELGNLEQKQQAWKELCGSKMASTATAEEKRCLGLLDDVGQKLAETRAKVASLKQELAETEKTGKKGKTPQEPTLPAKTAKSPGMEKKRRLPSPSGRTALSPAAQLQTAAGRGGRRASEQDTGGETAASGGEGGLADAEARRKGTEMDGNGSSSNPAAQVIRDQMEAKKLEVQRLQSAYDDWAGVCKMRPIGSQSRAKCDAILEDKGEKLAAAKKQVEDYEKILARMESTPR